jgi:hypothetical protein
LLHIVHASSALLSSVLSLKKKSPLYFLWRNLLFFCHLLVLPWEIFEFRNFMARGYLSREMVPIYILFCYFDDVLPIFNNYLIGKNHHLYFSYWITSWLCCILAWT